MPLFFAKFPTGTGPFDYEVDIVGTPEEMVRFTAGLLRSVDPRWIRVGDETIGLHGRNRHMTFQILAIEDDGTVLGWLLEDYKRFTSPYEREWGM